MLKAMNIKVYIFLLPQNQSFSVTHGIAGVCKQGSFPSFALPLIVFSSLNTQGKGGIGRGQAELQSQGPSHERSLSDSTIQYQKMKQ